MKFTDETICDAIRISWRVAHKADTIEESIRRWERVDSELCGFCSLLNWSVDSTEDRKLFNELSEDIIFLKRLAEFHAYGV